MIERDKTYQIQLSGEELAVFYYWSNAHSAHTLAPALKAMFSQNPPANATYLRLNAFLDTLFLKEETPEQKRLKELKALQTEIADEIKQLEEGK